MRIAIATLAALSFASPAAGAVIEYTLSITDAANAPITTAKVGDAFKLRVFVADVRTSPQGVYAAYVDVTYPGALATANGAIVHSSTYPNIASGTASAGLLDEVGGTDGFSPLGAGTFLVFEQAYTASEPGSLTFTTERPDVLPAHNNLVFGSNTAVPPVDITEDSATLTIEEDTSIFVDGFEGNGVAE